MTSEFDWPSYFTEAERAEADTIAAEVAAALKAAAIDPSLPWPQYAERFKAAILEYWRSKHPYPPIHVEIDKATGRLNVYGLPEAALRLRAIIDTRAK